MRVGVSLSLALAALLVAAPSLGQTAPVRLDDLIKIDQKIEVLDDQGHETKGRVSVLSDTAVSISANREVTVIPFEHITRISRPHDGLMNGTLIGLGTGALLGLLGSTIGTDACDPSAIVCFEGPRYVGAATLLFGAIGAGVGVAVDALIQRDRIVYSGKPRPHTRVAPIIGPSARGAVVSLTW